MSKHAKERGCAQTSLSRGGFKQLKIACKRPFKYLKKLARWWPCFVFSFVSLKPVKLLLYTSIRHFWLLRLQCFVQPAKNYADPLLIAKCGWLLARILCKGLGNRCKNVWRLNILRVPFLVEGCLPEINVEKNRTYFCRENDASRALDLRPACQNLGVPARKWMSCKWAFNWLHYKTFSWREFHYVGTVQSEQSAPMWYAG